MSPPGGIKSLLQKFDSGDAFSSTNHGSQRDYELEWLRHSGLVSKASSYLESLLEEERELLEREGIGSLIRELLKRKKLQDGQNGKQKVGIFFFQFLSIWFFLGWGLWFFANLLLIFPLWIQHYCTVSTAKQNSWCDIKLHVVSLVHKGGREGRRVGEEGRELRCNHSPFNIQ